ncbi:MAG: hypothetical protein Q9169_005940 [Polycauliona sp. 2 TL-2023]
MAKVVTRIPTNVEKRDTPPPCAWVGSAALEEEDLERCRGPWPEVNVHDAVDCPRELSTVLEDAFLEEGDYCCRFDSRLQKVGAYSSALGR